MVRIVPAMATPASPRHAHLLCETLARFWYCHSVCGHGGSAYDLEMALTNPGFRTAAQEVRRIVGQPDLHPADSEPPLKWGLLGWQHQFLRYLIGNVESDRGWKQNAIYRYFEADGAFSYVRVRFIDNQNGKTFRQYALSSNGGWISRKQAGKVPILYRLNRLALRTSRAAPQVKRWLGAAATPKNRLKG